METSRHTPPRRRVADGARLKGWAITSVTSIAATLVLAAVTGMPARSVPNLLPHGGEQAGPQLGI